MDSTKMMDPGSEATKEVTREDQDMINAFSRLNADKGEIAEEIKEMKERFANLEDANTELMMVDDEDECRYVIGGMYVRMNAEQANERVEAEMEKAQEKIDESEAKLADVLSQMTNLKARLYGKFGNQINLDE